MKCFQCNKKIENELDMVITAPDGDCFCNQKCHDDYKKEREHFFRVVVHDDKLFHNWLRN
jgi:hypothetical protein